MNLLLRAAIVKNNGLTGTCLHDLVEGKTQAIRKSGILEYYHRSDTFGNVGGLERLLEWFKGRRAAFAGLRRA